MKKPRLLWVRIADCDTATIPRTTAEEYFELRICSEMESLGVAREFAPHIVCFDFEQAHADQLRGMRDFKRLHPSIPLLMLTTQHSEALAVWAFRIRVWNFLVKPVRTSELRANFDVLARLVKDDRGPARAARCVGTLLPDDLIDTSSAPAALPLDPALRHVERHYASMLRQSAVAAACGMTVSAFSRAFKAEYGLTFREYLLRYRIAHACQLLKHGSHSATDVGIAVGFDDSSHFARAFRRAMGVSPSEFQRRGSSGKVTLAESGLLAIPTPTPATALAVR